MKTIFKVTLFLPLLLLFNCTNSERESIIIQVPQAKINQSVLIKIFGINGKKIRKAYFDCSSYSINKTEPSIDGCKKGLAVINDTVKIQFTPNSLGEKNFHKIKLLLEENESYTIIDTTFSYKVI